MKFKYSPEVDILMILLSSDSIDYGEDNEAVIVRHGRDGTPLSLEILDASLFVVLANTCLLTGQVVTNPNVSGVHFTNERDLPIRSLPKGNADWRFKYDAVSDSLNVEFGGGESDFCRTNHDIAVYYDRKGLPTGLKISKAREFVLGSLKSVLLHEEVTVA